MALVAGHREINIEMTRKPPSWWPVFGVLEGAVQVAEGEKTSMELPRTGLCVLYYQPSR